MTPIQIAERSLLASRERLKDLADYPRGDILSWWEYDIIRAEEEVSKWERIVLRCLEGACVKATG